MKKLILIALLCLFASPAFAADKEKVSVYDRVMRTGTIRCGYVLYPPALMRDPATGELSGIFYDLVNEMGEKLSLNIEWVQESGWGSFIQDLKNSRYDMMCTTAYKNSARAREADPTIGVYYSGIVAWAHKDDNRFDNGIAHANSPDYLIAAIDGSTPDFIAKTDFPDARKLSLPELSPASDLLLNVSTKKADLTFLENYAAHKFLLNNPDTIKPVSGPVRTYANVMWVRKGQDEFRMMLNTSLEEILNAGSLEKLFDKYNIPQDVYYPPAKPYEVPE